MKLLRGFVLTMIVLFVAIYWWHSYFGTPDASTMAKETTAQKGATNQRAVPVNINNTSVVPTDKVSSAPPVEMPQPPACPFSVVDVQATISSIYQASSEVGRNTQWGNVDYMAGSDSKRQAERILDHPSCQEYRPSVQQALNFYNQSLKFAEARAEQGRKEVSKIIEDTANFLK